MTTETMQMNGKYFGKVRNGGQVVFRTQGYVTEEMALADAKCWLAFHGEKMMETVDEKVWVPVDGGYEVELPYKDVMRIAIDYRRVRDLSRSGDQSGSKRALRPLLDWVRAEHQLTSRDMGKITHWWWNVDSKDRLERGRKAAEMIRQR